jgi:hypothetical protein
MVIPPESRVLGRAVIDPVSLRVCKRKHLVLSGAFFSKALRLSAFKVALGSRRVEVFTPERRMIDGASQV